MIHYCLAHTAYRLSCWLPRSHQLRLQVTVFSLAITSLVLQFDVLLRPTSSRYCSQPLLNNLVANIIFTFFTIGFTEKTTPELYYLSVLLSVSSLVSTVLFLGLGLLWLTSVTCAGPDAKPTA
ncbi:uncharacterized protein V5649_009023 [Rhynchonycteris naso]